jgi:hypothetical protein
MKTRNAIPKGTTLNRKETNSIDVSLCLAAQGVPARVTKSRMYPLLLAKVALLAGLTCFPAPAGLSQKPQTVSRPNLAGKWVLDDSKSSRGVVADMTVVISQNEPEIRITRRAAANGEERVDELHYYTDGRGETNRSVSTKTTWEGRKLVIKSSSGTVRNTGIEFERTEKWQLSKDDVLSWTTSFSVNGSSNPNNIPGMSGPLLNDIKRVFRRSPP